MTMQLATPRLIVRSFCKPDLEAFLAYRNDPEVYRFQGWKIPFMRVDGEKFIEKMGDAVPGTPGEWLQLAIELKEPTQPGGQSLVGDVAFHITRSNPRMAYLGYTLARCAWGKGYASEAVSRLLDFLFAELKLHRVVADCDVENGASSRLLERLGFRREGHFIDSFWLEREETWGSEYMYALLEREWLLR